MPLVKYIDTFYRYCRKVTIFTEEAEGTDSKRDHESLEEVGEFLLLPENSDAEIDPEWNISENMHKECGHNQYQSLNTKPIKRAPTAELFKNNTFEIQATNVNESCCSQSPFGKNIIMNPTITRTIPSRIRKGTLQKSNGLIKKSGTTLRANVAQKVNENGLQSDTSPNENRKQKNGARIIEISTEIDNTRTTAQNNCQCNVDQNESKEEENLARTIAIATEENESSTGVINKINSESSVGQNKSKKQKNESRIIEIATVDEANNRTKQKNSQCDIDQNESRKQTRTIGITTAKTTQERKTNDSSLILSGQGKPKSHISTSASDLENVSNCNSEHTVVKPASSGRNSGVKSKIPLSTLRRRKSVVVTRRKTFLKKGDGARKKFNIKQAETIKPDVGKLKDDVCLKSPARMPKSNALSLPKRKEVTNTTFVSLATAKRACRSKTNYKDHSVNSEKRRKSARKQWADTEIKSFERMILSSILAFSDELKESTENINVKLQLLYDSVHGKSKQVSPLTKKPSPFSGEWRKNNADFLNSSCQEIAGIFINLRKVERNLKGIEEAVTLMNKISSKERVSSPNKTRKIVQKGK